MTIDFQVDSVTTLPNGKQSATLKNTDGSDGGNVIGFALSVGSIYTTSMEEKYPNTGDGTHTQGPIG